MKASIPEPKELTEISTQTDNPSQDDSEESLFSDSDQEDQSDQIPKTVMSAQPRVSGASNEIQPTERPVTADPSLLPILNKTIEPQEALENVETEIIQPSSTVTMKQAEMKSTSIQTDPLPTLEVSDSPLTTSPKSKITPKRKNRKEKSSSEIKTKIQKTPKTPKTTKRENDDSGIIHVIPSHAQVFSREDLKYPEKSLKKPKVENNSNPAVESIQSGPDSSKEPLNTTKALVRCYNKLLWFGAEVEELTETKIIENISTFNENDLNDLNLHQMNQSVDILLEKLAYTIKQNNSHSGTRISDQGVSQSLGQQYEHLVGDYKRAINDLNKTNSKKIPFRQKKKQKSFSLRSKSSVELSGDYGIIEESSAGIDLNTEIPHLVQPNNSPNEPKRTKRREIKINMSFDSHKSQSFEGGPTMLPHHFH